MRLRNPRVFFERMYPFKGVLPGDTSAVCFSLAVTLITVASIRTVPYVRPQKMEIKKSLRALISSLTPQLISSPP